MHATSHILMIRPVNFTYNVQTAVNNTFQLAGNDSGAQEKALKEFDVFVEMLRNNDVDVLVVEDTREPHTPDSIFPNNWISFHDNGMVLLYPMYAENRRLERKPLILNEIRKRFAVADILDLSDFEKQGKFLEGTGSMVLDRDKKIAYACLSPRTDEGLLQQFCAAMHYHKVSFDAVDSNGGAIYHTNVMMCVGDRFVVICLESVRSDAQKEIITLTIKNSGKELIEISLEQMNHFAGNMLQVNNRKGKKLLVMSTQAYDSLNELQINRLRTFSTIIHSSLDSIETNGGGSARCMMAEIHLPIQK
jgi:hypothetical protein